MFSQDFGFSFVKQIVRLRIWLPLIAKIKRFCKMRLSNNRFFLIFNFIHWFRYTKKLTALIGIVEVFASFQAPSIMSSSFFAIIFINYLD